MMPSFVSRRLRWFWMAGIGTAAWMNRRDVARWARFGARSIAERDRFDLHEWLTEARVRAAITTDPVLRCDPRLDDVVVAQGKVIIRSRPVEAAHTDPHLDTLRKVKGVADVTWFPHTDVATTTTVPA